MVQICKELFSAYGHDLAAMKIEGDIVDNETILACIDTALRPDPAVIEILDEDPDPAPWIARGEGLLTNLAKSLVGVVITASAIWGMVKIVKNKHARQKYHQETSALYQEISTLIDQEDPPLEKINSLLTKLQGYKDNNTAALLFDHALNKKKKDICKTISEKFNLWYTRKGLLEYDALLTED